MYGIANIGAGHAIAIAYSNTTHMPEASYTEKALGTWGPIV